MLSTLLQLAGFACLVAAAATVSVAAGLVVAGVSLLLIGHASDDFVLRPPKWRWRR